MAVSVHFLMIVPIFLPFIIALLIFGLKKWLKDFAGEIAVASLIVTIAIIAAINFKLSETSTRIIYGFYNSTYGIEYGAPYGVQFRADSFSGWFLLLLNIIIAFVLIFESTRQRTYDDSPIYISLLLFLISGINASVLANDYFSMVFAWVLIGITLISLISFRKSKDVLREGAIRAYLVIGLSIIFLLTAAILTYGFFGSLNFDFIKNNIELFSPSKLAEARLLINLIMALTIVGFGLFANVFFLNLGLVKAIDKAPSSTQTLSMGIISFLALLSIFRVLYSLFDPNLLGVNNYSMVLTVIGLITAFEGALLMFYHITRKEKEEITLTKFIIFTILANIGVVLTGLSIGKFAILEASEITVTMKECLGYSVMQIINIAFASFLTFIAKDRVMSIREKSERLVDLKGIGKDYPITAFILVIGFSSMIGLLPTFGGVNIYMLLFSIMQMNFLIIGIILLVIISLILVTFLLLVKYLLFDKPETDTSHITGGTSHDLTVSNIIGVIIALGLIVLGIIPSLISLKIIENADLIIP